MMTQADSLCWYLQSVRATLTDLGSRRYSSSFRAMTRARTCSTSATASYTPGPAVENQAGAFGKPNGFVKAAGLRDAANVAAILVSSNTTVEGEWSWSGKRVARSS
jgi:hypothetical protein